MKIFGGNFKEGEILIQKDLANTLRKIRELEGKDFMKGSCRIIVKEMKFKWNNFT